MIIRKGTKSKSNKPLKEDDLARKPQNCKVEKFTT